MKTPKTATDLPTTMRRSYASMFKRANAEGRKSAHRVRLMDTYIRIRLSLQGKAEAFSLLPDLIDHLPLYGEAKKRMQKVSASLRKGTNEKAQIKQAKALALKIVKEAEALV